MCSWLSRAAVAHCSTLRRTPGLGELLPRRAVVPNWVALNRAVIREFAAPTCVAAFVGRAVTRAGHDYPLIGCRRVQSSAANFNDQQRQCPGNEGRDWVFASA